MIPASWLYGAAFAAGLIIAGAGQQWRLDALRGSIESERAESMRLIIAEQERAARRMAELDAAGLAEVAHEKEKTERLADCIARGTGCGLRVKVHCPTMPATAGAASLGEGSVVDAIIPAASGPTYRALRDRIAVTEAALRVCVAR